MTAHSVLLLGATSQIGVFLIPRLLQAGMEVTAISRDSRARSAPSRDGFRWLHADDLASMVEHSGPTATTSSVNTLLSCGPVEQATSAVTRLNLPGPDRPGQWRRAVVFSTSSVYTKLESPDSRERRQLERIREEEALLKAACEDSNTPLALLRPTMVYGCGMDQNLSRLYHWIRRYRFFPVAAKASGLRQPVHADDLAAVAVALLQLPHAPDLDSVVCGATTLSYRSMVELLFSCLGLPPRILNLPPRLLAGAIWLTGVARRIRVNSRESLISGQMALRQNTNLVFDDGPLRELTAVAPMPFKPTLDDFSVPALAAAFQLAAGEW